MDFDQISENLGHKKRTIRDFVKTLENTIDQVPVHAFLFGAGCSITSGVKSATQLTDEWREDIFKSLYSKLEYSHETAIEYFIKDHSDWYNRKHEYSVLFERMYSLPTQRRAYVEKLVDNKFPSLGYIYFLRLVESKFIDTVFTTNFDDLINESFYSFSSLRPIVCAHDSTIKSLLVNSKRPKIIKLHGDYLFEDIKNTLRETESLENNMRQKFIEFCKIYGLAILGYSGNDRSILDILYFLLKNDDYLKNGLYWCIKKGDSISDDIVQLLHHEKSFYIEIEGFDEFFCEVYNLLIKQSLSISNSFITNDNEIKLERLLNNDYILKTESPLLKDELEKLRRKRRDNSLEKMIESLSKDENNIEKKSNKTELSEQILLYSLYEDLHSKNFDILISKINKELEKEKLTKVMEVELLKLLVKSYRNQDNIKAAISAAERLLVKDEYDLNSYQLYISIETDRIKSLKIINKLQDKIPYSSKISYMKAKLINKIIRNDIIDSTKYESSIFCKDNIYKILLQGCEYNLSLTNPCWNFYFELNLDDYEENNTDKESLSRANEILNKYKVQNPSSLNIISKQVRIHIAEKRTFDYIDQYIEHNRIKDEDLDDEYLFLKLDVLSDLNEKEILSEYIEEIDSDNNNENLIYKKSVILVDKFNDIDAAIKLMENYLSMHQRHENILTFLYKVYLYKNDFEKAESLLIDFDIKNTKYMKMLFYNKKKEWGKVLELIEEIYRNEKNSFTYLAQKSHTLLCLKEFKNVVELLKPYLDSSNFSLSDDVIVTNYDLAYCNLKNNKTKPPSNRVERITKYSTNEVAKVAYFIMDKNYSLALEKYKEIISKSYLTYYDSIDNYFIDQFLDDKNRLNFVRSISEYDVSK